MVHGPGQKGRHRPIGRQGQVEDVHGVGHSVPSVDLDSSSARAPSSATNAMRLPRIELDASAAGVFPHHVGGAGEDLLPWCRRITSSHNASTEPMSWVDKTNVVPLSFTRRNISPRTKAALMGSSPLKGSSRMSSSGRCRTVAMNWIFWAMPLLRSATSRFHHPSTSSRSNQPFNSRSASGRAMPRKVAK